MLVSKCCLNFEQPQHHEGVVVDFCFPVQMGHDPLLLQETNGRTDTAKDMLLTWIEDPTRIWHLVLVEVEVVGLLSKLSLLYYQYYSALLMPCPKASVVDISLECAFPQ